VSLIETIRLTTDHWNGGLWPKSLGIVQYLNCLDTARDTGLTPSSGMRMISFRLVKKD